MKKFLFLVAVCIMCSTGLLIAQTITSNQTGTHNGYYYSFWNAGGGSVTMTLGAGGNYSVTWSNCNNFTCGKGWNPGSANKVINYSGSFNGGSNGYLAAYGWTKNALIEYYVVENYGSWTPPGGSSIGTLSSDGGTYKIYKMRRENAPSIIGTASFDQYWSVRTSKRSSGTVTLSNHISAWASKGMNMGSTWDYLIMETEGYQSSGSANITVDSGSASTTPPPITPTPTITPTMTPSQIITPQPQQNPIFSGGPYSFNGSSDFVDLPDNITNNLINFSVACRVKLNSITNWVRIFDFGGNTDMFMMLTPASGSTGYPYFTITTSSTSGEQGINGTSALPTGSWQHFAVVKNGNTGILYINGQEVGRNSNMTLRPADLGNTTNNYIGKSQWSNDPLLNGNVENFVFYNRAISAAEVQTLSNNSGTGDLGDVNGNGTVDITDALLIAQYSVGATISSTFIVANADVNKDGTVDIVDALKIAQYSVGLITEF